MGRLDSKVAIITGGSGGIGLATAEQFLKEGAKVVLVDISEEALGEAEKTLSGKGEVLTVKADVTNEDDVENYVKEAVNKFGQIDVLFNNAGIEGNVDQVEDFSLDNFNKVMTVNVNGVFLGMKHVLPHMKKQQSGSIINTSSTAGFMGVPGMLPYAASKHAVAGMTKTAALESAKDKVRVNSVHPAPVSTRMMDSIEKLTNSDDPESVKEEWTSSVPLNRYGKPEEIASLVLFLASDESEFITGAQYRIDGGMGATA